MKKILFIPILLLAGILSISAFKFSHLKQPIPPFEKKEHKESSYFMLLSDVHLNSFATSTKYGDDTGLELWNNLLTKLTAILNSSAPPAFIVYLGDLPAHYNCNSSCYLPKNARQAHNQNLSVILAGLRDLASKSKVPFFYVPGNNDPLSGDYYSFSDSGKQTPFSLVSEDVNPYPALNVAQMWNASPCMLANPYPTMGYYTASPMKGIRIIALNTIIFGNNYFPVDGISQIEAGNTEMSWLESQLMEAKKAGDKVYIAMHIPPGIDAYAFAKGKAINAMWAHLPTAQNTWLNTFLRLTDRYKNTIAGNLFGHTHMDEVRRLYDSLGTHVTSIAISCPGISTQHYNNPGFKLVYFDPKTKLPLDFVTRYTTPDASNWGNDSYRFSELFHCANKETILKCLKNQSTDEINKEMQPMYMVQHAMPSYDTKSGIDVRFGQ